MNKYFDAWNEKKKWLHAENPYLFFREREVWFCYLGTNIGIEEDGTGAEFLRPVIVFKKLSAMAFLAVPLTRTPHAGKYYFPVSDIRGASFAMLAQIRVIDAKRLRYKSRVLPGNIFRSLQSKLIDILER